MKYYDNNASTTPAGNVGLLNPPYYWWESGAMWGGMVDYWAYTGDQSYVVATQDALAAQLGPAEDLIIPAHRGDEVCILLQVPGTQEGSLATNASLITGQ